MNSTPAKAKQPRRKTLEPAPSGSPIPQPAPAPQPPTELAALQAGAGNAALAAAATNGSLASSSGLLPPQSTYGNAAAVRATALPPVPASPSTTATPPAPKKTAPPKPVTGVAKPPSVLQTTLILSSTTSVTAAEQRREPTRPAAVEAAKAMEPPKPTAPPPTVAAGTVHTELNGAAPTAQEEAAPSEGGAEAKEAPVAVAAKATPEAVAGAAKAQAPSTKPAATPIATPAEKSKGGPDRGKATAEGAEAQAGAPEVAAAPNPREAIAPAISAVRHRAAGARKHPPASAPVASAQAAAKVPETEQTRGAAEKTVKNLDTAAENTEKVKREKFKEALRKAIDDATTPKPTSASEAKKVMETGGSEASSVLRGELATERDAAAGPLQSEDAGTEVLPSEIKSEPKTELQLEQVGPPPAPVSAAPVVPAPLPPERLDYSSDRAPTDQLMAENNVSKEQLEKGNEPAFGPTLEARATAETHEATVEARYRQSESKVQDQAQGKAQQALAQGLTGVHGARALEIVQVIGQQIGTTSKDAAERQRITNEINRIKNDTRTDVDSILNSMETEAATLFEDGLKRAEKAYEDAFAAAKGGFKEWVLNWGEDWEQLIEDSLATARQEYFNQVDVAIDQVADLVDAKLAEAKQRVAKGLEAVDTFVEGLDKSVKKYGEEARQAVGADFDAMVTEIDQRRDRLIDKLVEQYKASYERMSAMEEKLREENKSLWQRVYDATVGVVKKIIAFKDMLLSVLGKAADLIVDIIADPIGFLGNLVSGIMQGLENFMGKIGSYLQKGLMEWLFGALAGSGLQLPDKFDLQGIISIVLQILGLTYAKFRARAVAIVGEPVVAALEQAAEVFKIVMTEGISGLWRFIKEQLADLKSMVFDAIFEFIKDRVIMAGITWIIGLLNPASAFFKACKAIYDIVMFFIDRGSQIVALVDAVIASIGAIAKGAISAAAGLVENALAKAIPVAIGFLASLLGLGDPTKPVRETIEKARSPVDKAIDWVINLAVKGVKAAGKFIGGLFSGKKPETGKDDKISETGDVGHDTKVLAGLEAIDQAEKEAAPEGRPTKEQAEEIVQKVKHDHPVFSSGSVVDGGDHWIYELTASKNTKHGKGLHPEVAKVIKKLKEIKGVQGIDKLIRALSANLTESQRSGYIFQAERTLHWAKQGVLKFVEFEAHFTSGGRVEVSVFDIVIEEEGVEGKEDSSGTYIFIDTKRWQEATRLGQAVLNSKTKAERDEARAELQKWITWLAKRLNKYRRLGLKVVIEWKGPIPEPIRALRKPASKVLYGSIDFVEIP